MATMNISLPDEMKAFVEEEAVRKGFGNLSEYVRTIIRKVQEEQAERERLDVLLLAGINSGPASPLSEKEWEQIRREGKKIIAEGQSKRQ